MVYSGWNLILFLVKGHMTFIFSCLTFFKFTLYFSVEKCCHFLTVRKSNIKPGNHKSVLENLAPDDVSLN